MTTDDTKFLRFVAICLILNSHLDLYSPYYIFGTGGAIGNVLFFMLSSFGLVLSEKRRPQRFLNYYAKRVRRIYPSVWVVVFFIMLPQYFHHETDIKMVIIFLSKCLWPPFWCCTTGFPPLRYCRFCSKPFPMS